MVLSTSAEGGLDATTTVSFASHSLGALTFDGYEIEWSTSLTEGMVTVPDLKNLSVSLTNDGLPVYTDHAMVSGIWQPIAEIPRSIEDISFAFDLSALPGGLSFLDNDVQLVQADSRALGLAHQILLDPTTVEVSRFFEGVPISMTGAIGPYSQSTVVRPTNPNSVTVIDTTPSNCSNLAIGRYLGQSFKAPEPILKSVSFGAYSSRALGVDDFEFRVLITEADVRGDFDVHP